MGKKQFLPSRRVLIFALFAAIGVVGTIVVSIVKSPDSSELTGATVLSIEMNNKLPYKDSDEDGIFDWEELVVGTDPHKKDSDGNGISDGEEFGSERKRMLRSYDYLVEEITLAGIQFGEYALGEIDENNLTQRLIRDSYNELGNSVQQGSEFGPEAQSALMDKFAKEMAEPIVPKYTKSDISVIPVTETSVVSYVSDVQRILKDYEIVFDENALDILDEWLSTKKPSSLSNVEKLESLYGGLHEALSKVGVPAYIADSHVEFINIFYQLEQALDDIKKSADDPVRGMVGAARYANYRSKQAEAVLALYRYVQSLIPTENVQKN